MKNKEKFIEQCVKNVSEICYFLERYCECILPCNNRCDECAEDFAKWLGEEYVEKPRLNQDEYVILKNVDKELKWIVRLLDVGVFLATKKPEKVRNSWAFQGAYSGFISFNHLFQFVKQEDEEPFNIQKLLDEYERFNGGK